MIVHAANSYRSHPSSSAACSRQSGKACNKQQKSACWVGEACVNMTFEHVQLWAASSQISKECKPRSKVQLTWCWSFRLRTVGPPTDQKEKKRTEQVGWGGAGGGGVRGRWNPRNSDRKGGEKGGRKKGRKKEKQHRKFHKPSFIFCTNVNQNQVCQSIFSFFLKKMSLLRSP